MFNWLIGTAKAKLGYANQRFASIQDCNFNANVWPCQSCFVWKSSHKAGSCSQPINPKPLIAITQGFPRYSVMKSKHKTLNIAMIVHTRVRLLYAECPPLKLQQPFSFGWAIKHALAVQRGGVKELVRVTYVPLNGFPSVLPSYSWNVSLIVPLRVTFSTEHNHWLVTILARMQFVEAHTLQLVSSFCKWTSAKWDCGLPSLASSSLSVRSDCSDPPSLLLSPSSSSSESSASTRGCHAN